MKNDQLIKKSKRLIDAIEKYWQNEEAIAKAEGMPIDMDYQKAFEDLSKELDKYPITDEPLFVLRAQDVLAPDTVSYWAASLKANGGNPLKHNEALTIADSMRQWQKDNFSKLPD